MKRMLLVGGGHAHLHVVSQLGRRPLKGWEVHLVSAHETQLYSGMVPGWIAGHHALRACQVPLRPLAESAGIVFHRALARSIDTGSDTLHCETGEVLPYDVLSLDVGAAPARTGIEIDSEEVDPIRPLASIVETWPRLMGRIAATRKSFHLVIVGSGAAGVELAFSIRERGLREGWRHLSVTVAGPDEVPLQGMAESARRRALTLMDQRGISWRGKHRVERIRDSRVEATDQSPILFDACWLATGAAAPEWLRDCNLELDDKGFVRVTPTLQAARHPNIFAAGDVASLATDLRSVPKSGVFAVRAGPYLARNLRAFTEGTPTQPWRPQRRALYLLSTGAKHAIGTWGRWSWQGGWAWHWKSRIDRGFVATYSV